MKCYIYSTALYGAKTWTLRKVSHKYLESSAMWCWRRMEISWTDRVRNEEVLHGVKEERNILRTIKRRKDTWIGHILCRKYFLKHTVEGKIEGGIEVTERQGRKRKQLLDDLKGTTGLWKLKDKVVDHILWRTRPGRGYGLRN